MKTVPAKFQRGTDRVCPQPSPRHPPLWSPQRRRQRETPLRRTDQNARLPGWRCQPKPATATSGIRKVMTGAVGQVGRPSPLRTGESISVAINCHPERSEGSGSIARRSFAALRMTVIDSPILRNSNKTGTGSEPRCEHVLELAPYGEVPVPVLLEFLMQAEGGAYFPKRTSGGFNVT